MSVLSDSNKVYSIEQAFKMPDVTSSKMKEAIKTWYTLYTEHKDNDETDSSQNLPYVIVNKLVKTMFGEYEYSVLSNGKKAEFMSRVLNGVESVRKKAVQQMLIGGECFIKPVLSKDRFNFLVVSRECFVPFARDSSGRITDVGLSEVTQIEDLFYTLFERRTVDENGYLTISYKLYKSRNRGVPGEEIPLNTLKKYENLKPKMMFAVPIGNVGMALLKNHAMNCIDGSADSVSIYAPAVKLIKNINRNEQLLDDEFENGASRIIASADMLKDDEISGKKKFTDNVFVGIDDNVEDVGVTIFSPALREQSYLNRKQEYLRNIESLIGFKRGILSNVESEQKTATEITSSAGDYNMTIIELQQSWAEALQEIVSTCDVLGQMYNFCDSSEFNPESDLNIDFGNGVLYDRDKEFNEYKELVAMGVLKPEFLVAWVFKIALKDPKDFETVREKYMPTIEAMLEGD